MSEAWPNTIRSAAIGGRMDAVGGSAPVVVPVPRGLRVMLERAGIQPPPPGQTLDLADVDAKLGAAQMPLDDRMRIKSALAERGFLSLGRKF